MRHTFTPRATRTRVLSVFAAALAAGGAASSQQAAAPEWNARAAEHLLNRAGFGAPPAEVAAAVAAGLDATVEQLLRGPSAASEAPTLSEAALREGVPMPAVLDQNPDFADEPTLVMRPRFPVDLGLQLRYEAIRAYTSRWIERMVAGEHPLRERMTLFWHGHFVSSEREVGPISAMTRQIDFLHANALGDFRTLVLGIARDPAMLEYLNNDINEKALPNENWARELMELFTLGEGHYTEDDIKQAARAFTGWTRRDGEFAFDREKHDFGPKTVLGVTGNLDGEAVIDILLANEQCARFLAGKLIDYFEGVVPEPARLERYAALLRENEMRIDVFLRTLFRDPAFYREQVVGNRVAAPVEYFVGAARRLGSAPPPDMLYVAASLAGQTLFAPPNVKGWEEGMAWLTTSSVMQRGNLVGILLGDFDQQVKPEQILMEMVESRGRDFIGPYCDYLSMTAWMQHAKWAVHLPLAGELRAAGVTADEAIVRALLDRLLPAPPSEATAEKLRALVAEWKSGAKQPDRSLAEPAMEEILKRLVHVILSLPEAQVS